MAKCVIHIGMHKTGTTSIQHSLVSLDDATHLYADIHGASNHSVPLLSAFSDSPMRHQINRQRGYDEDSIQNYIRQTRKSLRNSIDKAGARTLLISGEGMSGLNLEETQRMKTFFGRKDVDVEIVAYVRGAAGYMSSAFQQRLKSGNMDGFQAARVFPDYRRRLEKFDQVFGRDKVQLWKFDPPSFPEGSVVRDFCARVGINFDNVHEIRRNDSISRELAGILYRYGHWSRENNRLKLVGGDAVALTKLLGELPSTKLRLAPSVVRPILEANRDVIAWTEERIGCSLHEELGDDLDSDIASEADLHKPIPGAAQMLSAALKDAGIESPEPVDDDINPLIEAMIRAKLDFEGRRLRLRRHDGELPDEAEEAIDSPSPRRRGQGRRSGGRARGRRTETAAVEATAPEASGTEAPGGSRRRRVRGRKSRKNREERRARRRSGSEQGN